MASASTLGTMSPQLLRVVERAQREPEGRFHSLAHLIDVPALERAYHRMRKDAAVGVDGVTKEQYGRELERKQRELDLVQAVDTIRDSVIEPADCSNSAQKTMVERMRIISTTVRPNSAELWVLNPYTTKPTINTIEPYSTFSANVSLPGMKCRLTSTA